MDNVIELTGKITDKLMINSENSNAPKGDFVITYKGKPTKFATWKDVVFDKYLVGDEVTLKAGNYKDSEYGPSAAIIFIEYASNDDSKEEVEENSIDDKSEEVSVSEGSVIVIDGIKFRLVAI